MDHLTLDLDYRPHVGRKIDYGIGIVGAGAIVNFAHLPAYRKAGFTVVGITDRLRERAEETARRFDIPNVYDDLPAMLQNPEVEIVDIAIMPPRQLECVRHASTAGRHLLCQKPLSEDFAEAVEIVEIARRAGVKLAVNQQMRWDQGIRAAHTIIQRGWIGEPFEAVISVHCHTDWGAWPWLLESEHLEVMYHSIHYLDALRFLFGEPEGAYTTASRYPGQAARAETRTITILEYPGVLKAEIDVDHNYWPDDRWATFRFYGTEGIIKGTLGLLYNYPTSRPDTLEFMSRRLRPDYWFTPTLEGMWFPDAFIGTMGSLMQAIETDGEPDTSGMDNLNTLRLVHAAYRSMRERRMVRPHEVES